MSTLSPVTTIAQNGKTAGGCSTTVIVLAIIIAVLAVVAIIVGSIYTAQAYKRRAQCYDYAAYAKPSIHKGLGDITSEDTIGGALSNVRTQGIAPGRIDTPLPASYTDKAQIQAQAQAQAQAQQAQAQQAQAQAQAQAQQAPQAPQTQRYTGFGDNIPGASDSRKTVDNKTRDAMNAVAAGLVSNSQRLDGGWSKSTTPIPTPTPKPQQVEPLITAEQAASMIQNADQQSTIVVAMNGCPGCELLRATIRRLIQSGDITPDDRVGVLEKNEWMKIMHALPATQVPALFKVGNGVADKGPVGNQDTAPLLAFIKYRA
jgi:hypothetical protein